MTTTIKDIITLLDNADVGYNYILLDNLLKKLDDTDLEVLKYIFNDIKDDLNEYDIGYEAGKDVGYSNGYSEGYDDGMRHEDYGT